MDDTRDIAQGKWASGPLQGKGGVKDIIRLQHKIFKVKTDIRLLFFLY